MLPVAQIAAFTRELLHTQLSDKLTYHHLAHTEDVVNQVRRLADLHSQISEPDKDRLLVAAWWHDTGYTLGYLRHEERSCILVKQHLPGFGATTADIDAICGMIMATRIPQQPNNLLEQIICDADLDYLGRDDFFTQAGWLQEEWLNFGIIARHTDFDALQIKFLKSHHYFTEDSRLRRSPVKEAHLQTLLQAMAAKDSGGESLSL